MATDNQHLSHRSPPPPDGDGSPVAGPVAVPPADAAAGQPGVLAGQAVSMAGQAGRAMSWGRRIEKIILTLFCLEVGAFLLVFPWMPYWADNYFFSLLESWRPVVLSPYFRGAVSGLGALNLYLAIVESIAFVGSFLEEPARNEDQSSHRSS